MVERGFEPEHSRVARRVRSVASLWGSSRIDSRRKGIREGMVHGNRLIVDLAVINSRPAIDVLRMGR